MRENDVSCHVSAARSAPKDLAATSTAVKHTPLTAMLSPFFNSLVTSCAAMVSRLLPCCSLMLAIRPTSSTSPVNIISSPPLGRGKRPANILRRQNLLQNDAGESSSIARLRPCREILARRRKELSPCRQESLARSRGTLCPRFQRQAPPSSPSLRPRSTSL